MPARLEKKLAALPWMTPELLADLARPIGEPTDPAALVQPGAPLPIDPIYRDALRSASDANPPRA
jgi:hypothetical protein